MVKQSFSEKDVKDQLDNIDKLARVLLDRHDRSKDNPLVVTLVGAGASMSAGLPSGGELQEKIYEELVPSDEEKRTPDTLVPSDEDKRTADTPILFILLRLPG